MGCASLKILLQVLKSLNNDIFFVLGNVGERKTWDFHKLLGRFFQYIV